MDRETRRRVLWVPLAMWVALLGLLALTAGYAHISTAPGSGGTANLIIMAVMWAVIAMILMQVRESSAIVRLAAMAGLIWASFLFLFTFADLLTR
ncbi:MAG: hypothetical protein ACTHMG_06625 [Sphingomonas sp.]